MFGLISFMYNLFNFEEMRLWLVLLLVVSAVASKGNRPVSTIITGLWDINRGGLQGHYRRRFQFYLEHFKVLLQTQTNLIIFGTKELKLFVEEYRKRSNYVFIERQLEWFENKWHNALVQRVRNHYKETRPNWNQMKIYPEYGLYLYDTVVMSKLFHMRQALDHDIWNSDFFLWEDGGINHSQFDCLANQSVVAPNNMVEQMAYLFQWPINFHQYYISFKDTSEIIQKYKAFANFFDLYSQIVTDFASAYENFLRLELQGLEMKTEEWTITQMQFYMPYLIPCLTSMKEHIMHHHFEVNSYFQYRMRTDRRFDFGKELEGVIEVIQQEKQLWKLKKKESENTEIRECVLFQQHWMLLHNLANIKIRALKRINLFCLMLLLFVKAKRPEKTAESTLDKIPYDRI